MFNEATMLFTHTLLPNLEIMKGAKYITDGAGNRVSVVVPVREYEKLLEAKEELNDIRLYDSVKAKNEPTIKLEDYLKKRRSKGV